MKNQKNQKFNKPALIMAVIKHTEFKVICDGCACDLTDYVPARNQTEALKEMSKDYGRKFHRGKMYCDECAAMEGKPSFEFIDRKVFEGTKAIDVFELTGILKSKK